MSFDALSQIEKHEAAELLYIKKAKEQRKAANALRKQYKVKMEAEIVSVEEPAVPEVVIAQPVAVAESPLPSPAQMPRDFKELPLQAPGAPVKKARKPLTAEHLAKFQAGRQAWLEKKHAAAAAKQEPLVAKELDFSDVAAAIGVPAAEKLWASASPTASEEAPAAVATAAPPKKERKPLSDERLAYLKSPEHLAKMKAGREKKRASLATAVAPENEIVVGESPPSSTVKIYKLKGSSEERTAIIVEREDILQKIVKIRPLESCLAVTIAASPDAQRKSADKNNETSSSQKAKAKESHRRKAKVKMEQHEVKGYKPTLSMKYRLRRTSWRAAIRRTCGSLC